MAQSCNKKGRISSLVHCVSLLSTGLPFRLLDSVPEYVTPDTLAGLPVVDIGEPLDFGRDISERAKLCQGQSTAGGRRSRGCRDTISSSLMQIRPGASKPVSMLIMGTIFFSTREQLMPWGQRAKIPALNPALITVSSDRNTGALWEELQAGLPIFSLYPLYAH
ncbi:MAG: hypothetical protein K0S36_2198 [Nitrosospira multiformis]|jgi:hypothetical protein|nr:hypothetical protein [Nitrosospira multiformis]